ncbi:MAG TPA: hypothetical protein VFW05_09865 [Verrucomicrobiae bacterium]|jgi:Spy/CpxP family protein refolding chaperone|nr:hypothetical protein [Verrucomicrobiae bacterium]
MKLSKSLAVAAIALSCLTAGTALAQNDGGNGGGRRGGGNFDPAQFRERMMENIKEDMGVTDESEWKVIQDRIQKVMDARQEIGFGGGGRMFRRRGGDNNDNNGARRQRRGGFGTPNPEMEALQKAIDNNAPDAQVKAALEKYRAAQKAKEAALEKAQANLKSVLTPKQEAIAVADGLLK